MTDAPLTRPRPWVGAAVKRVEDPRLLRGGGRYLDDLRLPGLLHAAFVRSPHAHARVRAVETERARRAEGVAAVLSGRDLPAGLGALSPRLDAPGFAPTRWPALAAERVRFVGEAVAVVAAGDPYRAVDACDLVSVDYDPLPALPSVEAALADGAVALHRAAAGNVLFARRHSRGDVAGAFAGAAVVLRETFRHGRCSASPLEPRGVLAAWDGDTLTVWSGTQAPHILRAALAAALGLGEHRLRVVVPDTGGGFGQKMHVLPEDLAVAVLARRARRPVKWAETRRENLAAATHAREQRMEVELAADAAGRVLAIQARIASDAGAYHVFPVTAALEPLGGAGILPGPYAIPAYAYEVTAVATTKPPLGAYRGVGMPMSVFGLEAMLDRLAERLGLDPAEVRRRNLIPRHAYPFTSASGFVYDSGDFPQALARALDLSSYEHRRAAQAEARAAGRLVGIGISCYTEFTGLGAETYRARGMAEVPGPEAATVRMEPDGTVRCIVSFPSQGQGHATTVAQVVADQLGLALDRVEVMAPDTAIAPPGSGTFASRGAVVQGGAVRRAAGAVRDKVVAIAAGLLEASPADLELAGGRVRVRGAPGRALILGDVARRAYAPPAGGLPGGLAPGLEATVHWDPPGPTYSGAVHVASVEVDAGTGRVDVLSYAVVEDCGPLINPLVVEGQIHGALAQGIGEALGERLVYDEGGQLLTGSLMDYALPIGIRPAVLRHRAPRDTVAAHPRRAQGHGRGRHRGRARLHRQRRRRRCPSPRRVRHHPADPARDTRRLWWGQRVAWTPRPIPLTVNGVSRTRRSPPLAGSARVSRREALRSLPARAASPVPVGRRGHHGRSRKDLDSGHPWRWPAPTRAARAAGQWRSADGVSRSRARAIPVARPEPRLAPRAPGEAIAGPDRRRQEPGDGQAHEPDGRAATRAPAGGGSRGPGSARSSATLISPLAEHRVHVSRSSPALRGRRPRECPGVPPSRWPRHSIGPGPRAATGRRRARRRAGSCRAAWRGPRRGARGRGPSRGSRPGRPPRPRASARARGRGSR